MERRKREGVVEGEVEERGRMERDWLKEEPKQVEERGREVVDWLVELVS